LINREFISRAKENEAYIKNQKHQSIVEQSIEDNVFGVLGYKYPNWQQIRNIKP
jgi:hypothetical protein